MSEFRILWMIPICSYFFIFFYKSFSFWEVYRFCLFCDKSDASSSTFLHTSVKNITLFLFNKKVQFLHTYTDRGSMARKTRRLILRNFVHNWNIIFFLIQVHFLQLHISLTIIINYFLSDFIHIYLQIIYIFDFMFILDHSLVFFLFNFH